MAHIRKDKAWDNAVVSLERKGYTVEESENHNGTRVFAVTKPNNGNTQTTRYPDQIIEWAGTFPKAAAEAQTEASENKGSSGKLTTVARRIGDEIGKVLKTGDMGLRQSVEMLEEHGFEVELPAEYVRPEDKRYTIMNPSGEIYTTRRAGDISTVAHYTQARRGEISVTEVTNRKGRSTYLASDLTGRKLSTRKKGDLRLFEDWGRTPTFA